MNPITMEEAEEMGVPVCFTPEYAFHERNGTLPPYSGPVYPDHSRDDVDYYDPRDYDMPVGDCDPAPEPEPCQGPPPAFAFLGMPPVWHPHQLGCYDLHAASSAADDCPPPF